MQQQQVVLRGSIVPADEIGRYPVHGVAGAIGTVPSSATAIAIDVARPRDPRLHRALGRR
jgi:hypothetical protein